MYNPKEVKLELSLYLELFARMYGWHEREQRRYDFHEVIENIIKKHRPDNIALLAAEYPHKSVSDPANVAYTRDQASGENDRQTVTSFGRYIRRHFSCLKDHEVRDYVTKCNSDIFEIWDTSDDIVRSVQLGPKSCMTWDSSYTPGSENYNEENQHPYRVYDPKLGWKAVVRLKKDTGRIDGRALVFHDSNDNKYFVRTYKRCVDYSYADETLEFWLKENGYQHKDSWPNDTPLRLIRLGSDSILAPYLDGGRQEVDICESTKTLRITDNGDYCCDNTDGEVYENEPTEYCDSCGEYFSEDDMVETEDSNYGYVCQCCHDNNFVDALGYRGRTVRLHEDTAVQDVHYEYYDPDWLEDNNVAYAEDGELYPKDELIGDSYGNYHCREDVENDSSAVIIDDIYYDESEVFYCEGSNKYYPIDEADPVEVDGKVYHPDHAPEEEHA